MDQATYAQLPISEIARNALTEMRKHGVAVTPQNYHVWFEHLTGTNPQLTRALDLVIAAGKGFGEADSTDLYERFIGNEHQKILLKQIQQQTREMLKVALTEMQEASSGACVYGEKLDEHAKNLTEVGALGDIQSVVLEIITDTKTMVQTSKDAQIRLEEATRKARELEDRLATAEANATRDGLTGILNRAGGDVELSRVFTEWKESGEAFSLVVCDIDHFKKFNDTYGHLIGDAVLRTTANSLSDGIKGQDTAVRWGGEEFLLILPGTSASNARHVAESLRRRISIRKLRIADTDAPLEPITMSFGVAEVRKGDDADCLIERADKALYLAKETGRNRVCSEAEVGEAAGVA